MVRMGKLICPQYIKPKKKIKFKNSNKKLKVEYIYSIPTKK